MQPASTAGYCPSPVLHTSAGGEVKVQWDKERWQLDGNQESEGISSVWQYFDEESDNKVMCRLCKQKLTYNHSTGAMRNHIQLRHLDVNLQESEHHLATLSRQILQHSSSLLANQAIGLCKCPTVFIIYCLFVRNHVSFLSAWHS